MPNLDHSGFSSSSNSKHVHPFGSAPADLAPNTSTCQARGPSFRRAYTSWWCLFRGDWSGNPRGFDSVIAFSGVLLGSGWERSGVCGNRNVEWVARLSLSAYCVLFDALLASFLRYRFGHHCQPQHPLGLGSRQSTEGLQRQEQLLGAVDSP